ncbi:MAG TPA: hypothetical protein VGN37_27890 [Actinocatenispora sp.]
MTDIRELLQEAADSTRPPGAHDMTRAVTRRVSRVRRTRFGTAAVAVVVALGLAVGGMAYVRGGYTTPAPPATAASALPTDRAVGVGTRIEPRCGGGRCVPEVTTTDGHRYALPGPWSVDGLNMTGVGLSPGGRWLFYHDANGAAVVRDLSGTAYHRVAAAKDLGGPVVWSANEGWVLIEPVRREGPGTSADPDHLTRLDLDTGRAVSFSLTGLFGAVARPRDGWQPQLSLLPNGQVAFPISGHAKPTRSPVSATQFVRGDGTYRIGDPATGHVVRDLPVHDSVTWMVTTVSQGSGPAQKKWEPSGPARLCALPDGSRAVISSPTKGRGVIVGFIDLTTGDERSVDVTTALLSGTQHRPVDWALARYSTSGITFWAIGTHGQPVSRVTLSPDGRRVLAVHPVSVPPGTRMPG